MGLRLSGHRRHDFEVSDWVEPFIDYRYLGTGRLLPDPLGMDPIDDDSITPSWRACASRCGSRPGGGSACTGAGPSRSPRRRNAELHRVLLIRQRRADARAPNIIGLAANAARQSGSCKITVTGHTDTSGSQAYNENLSQRRAQNVAAALVSDGIAQGEIVVQWRGEAQPLVPTGDAVKEAQNRRVTIDMI
jgi:hypothetical protein